MQAAGGDDAARRAGSMSMVMLAILRPRSLTMPVQLPTIRGRWKADEALERHRILICGRLVERTGVLRPVELT